ncbi:hypothetical protein OESDEN_09695, partial [Oesophagostomum dentatum]
LLTVPIWRYSCTNVSVHNLLLKTFFTICLTCQTHGLICKFGKGNQTRFDETLRKYCVYYEEYSTDECNSEAEGKFGALSTIDEISGKCMAYRYPKGLDVVVACFCREDGCNALNTIIVGFPVLDPVFIQEKKSQEKFHSILFGANMTSEIC